MNIDTKISMFFDNPQNSLEVHKKIAGGVSILYLLRRDIKTCLGIDPSSGESIDYKVIWPGCMAILAGIDLLAKFYAGSDKSNEVGKRFRKFWCIYFNNANAEIIYQLRNALIHSFGLYSENIHQNKIYKFTLVQNNLLLVHQKNDEYLIGVGTLHNLFENAIIKYYNDLINNKKLIANFENMFPRYGQIFIEKITFKISK